MMCSTGAWLARRPSPSKKLSGFTSDDWLWTMYNHSDKIFYLFLSHLTHFVALDNHIFCKGSLEKFLQNNSYRYLRNSTSTKLTVQHVSKKWSLVAEADFKWAIETKPCTSRWITFLEWTHSKPQWEYRLEDECDKVYKVSLCAPSNHTVAASNKVGTSKINLFWSFDWLLLHTNLLALEFSFQTFSPAAKAKNFSGSHAIYHLVSNHQHLGSGRCHRRVEPRPVEILGIQVSPVYLSGMRFSAPINLLLGCVQSTATTEKSGTNIFTLTVDPSTPWDPKQFLSWACPCRNSANLPGTAPEGPHHF